MADLAEELLAYCRENDRVCPLPQQWSRFCQLLSSSPKSRQGLRAPLILSAWDTPALLKIIRLKEQIEWAAKSGLLYVAARYLRGLAEEEWFHIGD